jgi:ATP-dependent Clp protease protease subunit
VNNQIEISIPKNVENLSLPSPELITFYKNINNRILWLDAEVDDYYLEFLRYILSWNQEDRGIPVESRKPIKLLIHSYGGDLDINNSLIDAIKMSSTPIYGYNMGAACSAACFIFMACHKRFSMPNAYFLIHKGSTGNISGTFDQVISEIQEYQRKIEALSIYILANTKIDEETLEENITTEWYISAAQSVEYGISDSIIKNIDEII